MSALSNSPKAGGDDEDADLDLEDPFAAPAPAAAAGVGAGSADDNDEPSVRDEPAVSSAATKDKKSKKKGKSSLLAPPANDTQAARTPTLADGDDADDSADKLDDDWMSKF